MIIFSYSIDIVCAVRVRGTVCAVIFFWDFQKSWSGLSIVELVSRSRIRGIRYCGNLRSCLFSFLIRLFLVLFRIADHIIVKIYFIDI